MKTPKKRKQPKQDLALRLIGDLKKMGQALACIETAIRNKPELFTCANDFVLMNIMKDRVQSGAIGVGHAISWAHGEKYGRLKPSPIPDPIEYDSCPHCRGSFSFAKLVGNNCPHCKKQVRTPNAFVNLFAGGDPSHNQVLSDIDQTP